MKAKIIILLLAAMLMMTSCDLTGYIPEDLIDLIPDNLLPEETQTEETEAPETETPETETPVFPEVSEEPAEPAPAVPEEPAEPAPSEPEQPVIPPEEYMIFYMPVVDELFKVAAGEYGDGDIPEGGTALMEGNIGSKDNIMLWNAGFALRDLSGDGIPELLIGTAPQGDGDFSMLCALYTLTDGEAHLVLEGFYRNAYYLLDDGTLLNQGSAGAIYSVLGLYELSEDGREMFCKDFWFTHEKDGNYEDIRCWHNMTGEMDPAVSEELDMTLDAFWEMEADLMERRTGLELTTFGEYGGMEEPQYPENPTVEVVYASQFPGEYDAYTADTSEYAAEVAFVTDGAVRDFTLLALTAEDISDEGEVTFSMEEVYVYGDLTPACGLVVTMNLPEVIPFYGISYMDGTGTTRVFSVNLSGYDGSVYLTEIGGVG